MKLILHRISLFIDRFTDKSGAAISWLTAVLMIIICIDVIMRYLFSSTKTWIIELEWHLFAVIFLIGASYGLLHDKHVRVDLFYERFSTKKKKWVNMLGILIFLIPWTLVVIYYGWEYALNSFSFRESSSQPNGLPARYVIKSFIWIGFGMLLMQGVSEFIKNAVGKSK